MITLSLLTFGFILAWLIARWNESNKLFWILFTSFVVGIAGGSVYAKIAKPSDDDESCAIVTPTSEFVSADTAMFVTTAEMDTEIIESNQMSKDTVMIVTDSSSMSCSPMEGNGLQVTNPVKPKVCSHISTQVD